MEDRPEPLLPPNIVEITAGLGISDYTPEGVDEAIGRYWDCVERLEAAGCAANRFMGGVPIFEPTWAAAGAGTAGATRAKAGLPADSTNEAIIAALEFLGIRKLPSPAAGPSS